MGFIIIKTTFEDKKDAEIVAKKLIESKLGACVQISEIESYYRWKDNIENSQEYKVEIKTLEKNYKKVEELILNNHEYETPEIVSYRLNEGSQKYFDWMEKSIE